MLVAPAVIFVALGRADAIEKAEPIVRSAATTRTGPANLWRRYLLTRANDVIEGLLQLLDQVNRGEKRDPYDVDEVPVIRNYDC